MAKGKKSGVKKDRTTAVLKTRTRKLKKVLQSCGIDAAWAYAQWSASKGCTLPTSTLPKQ